MSGDPVLSMPELRERGWTPAMIRDLLGDHDAVRPNPFYRTAAPMRLWSAERVGAAEAREEFTTRLARSETRSAAASEAAEKRREELLDAVNLITVRVPAMDEHTLAVEAIANRNDMMQYHASGNLREGFEWANPDAPGAVEAATLDRWKVNYLRHILTDYEQRLEEIAGKVGVRDAGAVIRHKVYSAVAQAYPGLAAECRKQEQDRRAARISEHR